MRNAHSLGVRVIDIILALGLVDASCVELGDFARENDGFIDDWVGRNQVVQVQDVGY